MTTRTKRPEPIQEKSQDNRARGRTLVEKNAATGRFRMVRVDERTANRLEQAEQNGDTGRTGRFMAMCFGEIANPGKAPLAKPHACNKCNDVGLLAVEMDTNNGPYTFHVRCLCEEDKAANATSDKPYMPVGGDHVMSYWEARRRGLVA